jgi:hypothetical protein
MIKCLWLEGTSLAVLDKKVEKLKLYFDNVRMNKTSYRRTKFGLYEVCVSYTI